MAQIKFNSIKVYYKGMNKMGRVRSSPMPPVIDDGLRWWRTAAGPTVMQAAEPCRTLWS